MPKKWAPAGRKGEWIFSDSLKLPSVRKKCERADVAMSKKKTSNALEILNRRHVPTMKDLAARTTFQHE
jgi:hypothetical protein